MEKEAKLRPNGELLILPSHVKIGKTSSVELVLLSQAIFDPTNPPAVPPAACRMWRSGWEGMAINFSLTSAERSEELIGFLRNSFGITKLPPNFSAEVQAWKYFAPHPWWTTARSYLLETEKGIAAHGCLAPVRFAAGNSFLESMVIMDWAAGDLIPGAGLLLCRRCIEARKSSLLAIDGSRDTLRLLPKVAWFRPQTDMRWYARPLKPWRRFLRSRRGGRDFAKFCRNLQWKLFPELPATGSWTCRASRSDDPVFTPSGDFTPILRTRAWIDYLSACPVAKCNLWILEKDGVPSGHALIANLVGSARVADFALGGQSTLEESTQAFSTLVRTLAAENDILEVVAASSLTQDLMAFEACGLRQRKRSPVLLADVSKAFPEKGTLEIKPMLSDAFYLHDPANPFLL